MRSAPGRPTGHAGRAAGRSWGSVAVALVLPLLVAVGLTVPIATPSASAAPVVPSDTTASYLLFDRDTGRATASSGEHRLFRSASLVKLLIALDYLETKGPTATIPAGDLALLQSMLRSSDDDAASTLWVRAGYEAVVTRMVPKIGLVDTQPPTDRRYWGYTAISAADIVTVYNYILDRAPTRTRDLIVGNLQQATQCAADGFDQFFGIPRAVSGSRAVKQGWSGYGSAPPAGQQCTGGGTLNTPPSTQSAQAAQDAPAEAVAARGPQALATPAVDLTSRAMHTSGLVDGTRRVLVVLTLSPTTKSFPDSSTTITDVTRQLYGTGAPGPAPTADFVPVRAARLLDTRSGSSTVDGQANGTGVLGADSTRTLPIAGRGGVPASGARVAVLTVTALAPTSASYVTVSPSGRPRPTVSNLNLVASRSVTGTVVVPLGPDGAVSIYNQAGSTGLTVDVVGWYRTAAAVVTDSPRRLQDTRPGAAYPTFDGQAAGGGAVGAGQTRDLQVDGRAFAPAPPGASVLVSVTAVNPTASTFVTVWPAGAPRPTASNLNLVPGQVLPNLVLVPVGAGGRISLYNLTGTTDLVVDLQAVVPAGASTRSVTPARLLDTRAGTTTVDGQQVGQGALASGQTRSLPVLGRGPVPVAGVAAVVVNITGVSPSAGTTLAAWPTAANQPPDPNLTVGAGEIRPGLSVVPVGADGAVQLRNQNGSTDLVVDVLGYLGDT